MEKISIYRLIPNLITLANLCFGISAVRYGIAGMFETAALLLLIATLLDGVDGHIARMLNANSKFGAQLDSLADIVSFGAAPSLLLYMFVLNEVPYRLLGWSVVLFYNVCAALRLARFHCESEEKSIQSFFTGVPITIAAIILIMPITLTFEFEIHLSAMASAIWTIVVSLLMISEIPTPSLKTLSIAPQNILYVLSALAILLVGIIIKAWVIIPIICAIYICIAIPVALYKSRAINKKL